MSRRHALNAGARLPIWLLALSCALHLALARAEPAAVAAPRDASQWLERMHAGARERSYTGTFVVSAAAGSFSSARISHGWSDGTVIERVEALSGPQRVMFRREGEVVTYLPQQGVVRFERRQGGVFPNLAAHADAAINQWYRAQVIGSGRVAGFEADVVQFDPRDALRFGYRMWSERRTGLLVKLQTLDQEGRVIEQSAFSELQLDAPVQAASLVKMMGDTAGFKLERVLAEPTSAAAEGWTLREPVAGFSPALCLRRPMQGPGAAVLQWTFSDGLAMVSLFLEPYDAQRHRREGSMAMGATHTLMRRVPNAQGDWWLTAVGEVPLQTLSAFAQALTRSR